MSVKKCPPSISITVARSCGLRKELEQLHARRMAITTLIESLEDYDRFRMRRFGDRRLRTA
jgi:cell division protein FtsB